MTMITPSYLGETIEYSSLHACRSTLEDPTTRVVFDGPKRTAELSLLNIGDKPATYRISFIHQRMNEDGKLEEIKTGGPGEQFVDDLVRFTPRQVVLEPRVAQVVRLQLRLPAALDTGEYRSHLLFRAVPVAGTSSETTAPATAQQGVSIKITPIYGVSIPVIVRHGATSATAALANLKLQTGPVGVPLISGRINRMGNRSVYGDMQVAFAAHGGAFKPIGRVGGVAVYTPNAGRNFLLKLTPPEGLELRNGALRVTYRQQAEEGGAVLAEGVLTIP